MREWRATLNGLCCALACVNRYMQIARKKPLDEVAKQNISILLDDIEVLKERYLEHKKRLMFDGGLDFLNDDTYFDGFKVEHGELSFSDKKKVEGIISQWINAYDTEDFNCYRYEVATYVLFMIQTFALDKVDVFGEDIARLEGRTVKKVRKRFFRKRRAA